MDRVILHVDMDAFFAAVEQKDNPKLRGKPVIVGGIYERGVVSTCSYEARKYGVHSAMPGFIARKKCPMGIFLPVRYDRYKEISNQVFNILRDVTEIIEPLSIDEAYLDLSGSGFDNGMDAAIYIKRRVKAELGLNISVGISYNKFLAKLASDWNKPNGIMVINKEMIPELLLPLEVKKIYGLGIKSVNRLNNMGIFTVEDLFLLPKEFCMEYLGKSGLEIYDRIRGIDNREVIISRERKSVGKERTLTSNTMDKQELLKYIKDFSIQIGVLLEQKSLRFRTITLKYKTKEFDNHSRSKTFLSFKASAKEIFESAKELLETEELKEEVRLIGISVSSFNEDKIEQLTLF